MSCPFCNGLGFHMDTDEACTCIGGHWFRLWTTQNLLIHELGIALMQLEIVAPVMAQQPMFANAIAAYRNRQARVLDDSSHSAETREAQPVSTEHTL